MTRDDQEQLRQWQRDAHAETTAPQFAWSSLTSIICGAWIALLIVGCVVMHAVRLSHHA